MKLLLISQIFILLICSACSQPLKTLIRVSKEQDAQAKYISIQEKKFKVLLSDIERQKIRTNLRKEHCVSRYGEPIVERKEADQMVLLFRRPRDFFPTEKVYLYFDQEDRLKKWVHHKEEGNPIQ